MKKEGGTKEYSAIKIRKLFSIPCSITTANSLVYVDTTNLSVVSLFLGPTTPENV